MERKAEAPRGLRMILEDLMLDLMYYLPSYKKVREFLVTKEMVMTQKINMAVARKRPAKSLPAAEIQEIKVVRYRGSIRARCPASKPFCKTHLKMLTSKEKSDTKRLPMMPIRDVVIFPYMMTPFVVGRESSVRALEEALAGDKKIFLATQHDPSIDEPRPDEIYSVGTIANIVQSLKQSDGNIKVLVEGVERGKIVSVSEDEGYFRAVVKSLQFKVESGPQLEQLISRCTTLFEQYVKLSQNLNYETMIAAIRVDDPSKLADTVGANLQLTIEEKQELLEIFDPVDRLTRVAEMLDIERSRSRTSTGPSRAA